MYTIRIGQETKGIFRSATEAIRYGIEVYEPYGLSWDWEQLHL